MTAIDMMRASCCFPKNTATSRMVKMATSRMRDSRRASSFFPLK